MNRWRAVPLLRHCSSATFVLGWEVLRYRWRAAGCLALLLLGAVLTSQKFLLLRDLVHAGVGGDDAAHVGWLLVATIACWLAQQGVQYAVSAATLRYERLVSVELVQRAMLDLFRRSTTGLRHMDANTAVRFLRTGMNVSGKSIRGLLGVVNQLVLVAASLVTAFWLGPIPAAVCLLAAGLGLDWTMRHLRRQRAGTAAALAGQRQLHERLCRIFEAHPQLKVYGAGPGQLERLAEPVRRQREGEQQALLAQRRSVMELNLVGALAGLAIVGLGAWLVHQGRGQVADVTALLVLQQSVFSGLRAVLNNWSDAEENGDFLDKLLVAPEPAAAPRPGAALAGPVSHIAAEGAVFAVGDTVLLSEATCRLEAGKLYGVVGASGSGKTMLLHLLSARSRPQDGRLTLNGLDVRDLDPEDVGRRVALVTWPPLLMPGTLAENLRVARPAATDEELRAALARAAFAADLERLAPLGGLNVAIGHAGVQLSVGQLQRLALARAFLREPEVLLVDDLLTGLDPDSAHTVLASLREYARTRIVVLVASNSLAWDECDELLVTADGRLAAQTTPDGWARGPLAGAAAAAQAA